MNSIYIYIYKYILQQTMHAMSVEFLLFGYKTVMFGELFTEKQLNSELKMKKAW